MTEKSEKKVEAEKKRLKRERQVFLDEMFNDVYAKRRRIYHINFFRGVFFGAGTFLGGTVGIALLVWVLTTFFSEWPIVQRLLEALQR